MTVFSTIFEVNSSIDKLWDLLAHLVEKDMVDLNQYYFFVCTYDNCVTFAQTL